MTASNTTGCLAQYLGRMMTVIEPSSAAGRVVSDWLRHYGRIVGIDFAEATTVVTKTGKKRRLRSFDKPLSQKCWQQLRRALETTKPHGMHAESVALSNAAALAEAMALETLERETFTFVFQCDRNRAFDLLCARLVATREFDSAGVVAAALGHSHAEVWRCLVEGPLHSLGLVELAGDGATGFCFFVPYHIRHALLPPHEGIADIERTIIGAPLLSALSWEDFDHLARARDFIARLLEGAVSKRETGVNILLHGIPGAGKTELCKAIAKKLEVSLFAIGEADEDGDEPNRYDRLAALRMGERLIGRRGRALLLFDEMEDILMDGVRTFYGGRTRRRAGSKVFLNGLLENNRIPVFWTANALDDFDPAFLRRMSFILEMNTPPTETRRRLWAAFADRRGLELEDDTAITLSRRHKVPPSVMENAVAAVTMAEAGAKDLDFVVSALAKPLLEPGRRHLSDGQSSGYDLTLVKADTDLEALAAGLSKPAAPRDFALCCYGPPGTGKSAFVRRLSERIELDVLEKRGSDLLSKWVGGTERLIAEAFEEALEDNLFLIIDEADTLLFPRIGAQRSWEVSMVNELLVAMESHPLPFACTTNQLERIDGAALRRFTFKIGFDFLSPELAQAAFKLFFHQEAPAELLRLNALTPGDFAAVSKKLRFLDRGNTSAAQLLDLLEKEVGVKPDRGRTIGFAAPIRPDKKTRKETDPV